LCVLEASPFSVLTDRQRFAIFCATSRKRPTPVRVLVLRKSLVSFLSDRPFFDVNGSSWTGGGIPPCMSIKSQMQNVDRPTGGRRQAGNIHT
jgi:hypothetical protein